MSRTGKIPIEIPENVRIDQSGRCVEITGPVGSFNFDLPEPLKLVIEGRKVMVRRRDNSRDCRRLQGLLRSLLKNCIEGVEKGFEKRLEIVGLGYRADLKENDLVLNLGFSTPYIFPIPPEIDVSLQKNTIIIKGADKQLVGETAAKIRRIRPPEPYKGKGIRYSDEYIRKKAGKAGKTTA